ncbi:MAG: DUF1579 domain-containing protein [Acidobacteria bacterium]|nr:DUF1579 domain-containing protein [Acidobacteriota bacterium]
MKRTSIAAVALAAVIGASPVLAQNSKEHPQGTEHPKSSEHPASTDPMMKAWMEFATPGAPHQGLLGMVGTWDTTVKFFMDPANPSESKGTSTYTSLLDGRYVQEVADGSAMGMPFHGLGIYGYDNLTKKYVSCWIDNMGTGLMTGTGSMSADGKMLTWMSTSSDPMSGKEQSYRSTMLQATADQYVFEMFGPGPEGKEAKMMSITYNRRK